MDQGKAAVYSVAVLTYDAASQRLSGQIGAAHFAMKAFSGGGRGSTVAGVAQTSLASKLSTTATIKTADGRYVQRGGALPPGHYQCQYLANHRTFHECIRLLRTKDAAAIHTPFASHAIDHGRGNDFFIHGMGVHGSDGCIVPALPFERSRLNHAVQRFTGKVLIHVVNGSYMLPAELGGFST